MKLSGKVSKYSKDYLLIKIDDGVDADEIFKRVYKYGERCEVRMLDKRVITSEQRRKIYAVFGEVAQFMGDIHFGDGEYVKNMLKGMFLHERPEYGGFSLGDCSVESAGEFIDFLIGFCLEHSIPTQDTLLKRCEDIRRYMYQCLKHKKCAVCNKPGEVHFVDAIGLGSSQKTMSSLIHRRICLCSEHYNKARKMGWQKFSDYRHVVGVLYNETKDE